MNCVVLVGFPGSGKTTIGKKLAAKLHFDFIDTDTAFEMKYHISIPDFFNKYGEEWFRKCEYTLLKEVLHSDSVVISTGGGTPCYADAMDIINEHAYSVYIQLSPVSLVNRLEHAKKKRPLINSGCVEDLQQFVNSNLPIRQVYYQKASFCIKGENIDIELLTNQIALSLAQK